MGNWSSRQDYYLHQFVNPRVQEYEEKLMVRMYYDQGSMELKMDDPNPFKTLVSLVDEQQRVIIKGMYLLFVNNEFTTDLEVKVTRLFDVPRDHANQDIHHPDDTAQVTILCPRDMNAIVRDRDAVLYKPRLPLSVLTEYVGLEGAILEPQSVKIPTQQVGGEGQEEVFEKTNPLVPFILNHKDELKPTPEEFVKMPGPDHQIFYKIQETLLVRVRDLFRNTIFHDMRYTRFEDCRFQCKLQKEPKRATANLCFILELKYLVITPGEGKMHVTEIKL